jgi:exopolyphosphatase/guanosine-5'-triphosphate,3'-diphosphate pyrophosphatase
LLVTGQAGKMTALGRGVAATGQLEKQAITATAQLVAAFLRQAGPVAGVFCVGTAAAREARNTEDLWVALHQAGVELEVISGEEEARLSYRGAVALVEVPRGEQPLVADLGGKSLELALRRHGRLRVVSVPLGARALTEAYLRSQRPGRGEIAAARRAARQALAPGGPLLDEADLVVATGGTAFTAALVAGRWTLSAAALQSLRRRLGRLPLPARRAALSFDPDRAEVICGGLVALEILAEHAPGCRLAISAGGVREGLLLERTGARRVLFPEGVGRAG